MADEKAYEVFADHAFTGGYDLNTVYGKKKPSNSSTAGVSSHGTAGSVSSDASYGGYGGSQHSSSPYTKPPPASENYSEVTDEYGLQQPGYGKKPDSYEAYDNESESRPSGRRPGFAESESQWRPEHGRKPGYGEDVSQEGYSSRPGYGRTPGYAGEHEAQGYGRKPAYGGDEELPARPSQVGNLKYGDPEEDEGRYHESGYGGGRKSGHHGQESEYGRQESEYGRPRPPGAKIHEDCEESEYGGRKPTWQEDIGESGYGGGRKVEHEYDGGRRPGYEQESEYGRPSPGPKMHEGYEESGYGGRKPTWQQDTGDSGYGRHEEALGYESGHKKHGPPNESVYGDEGRRQSTHDYGEESNEGGRPRPPSYGRPGYGRRNEDDELASETSGLSLGTDSYSRRPEERFSDNRDYSDEEEKHKKHGHHHRREYEDDDY